MKKSKYLLILLIFTVISVSCVTTSYYGGYSKNEIIKIKLIISEFLSTQPQLFSDYRKEIIPGTYILLKDTVFGEKDPLGLFEDYDKSIEKYITQTLSYYNLTRTDQLDSDYIVSFAYDTTDSLYSSYNDELNFQHKVSMRINTNEGLEESSNIPLSIFIPWTTIYSYEQNWFGLVSIYRSKTEDIGFLLNEMVPILFNNFPESQDSYKDNQKILYEKELPQEYISELILSKESPYDN